MGGMPFGRGAWALAAPAKGFDGADEKHIRDAADWDAESVDRMLLL
jgi:hypothetical protein